MPHLAPKTFSDHNWPRFDTPGRVHHAAGTTSMWLAYHNWSLAGKLYIQYILTHHESERVQYTRQHKKIGCQYRLLHWIMFRLHRLPAIVDDADGTSLYCWPDCVGSGLGSTHLAHGLLLVPRME